MGWQDAPVVGPKPKWASAPEVDKKSATVVPSPSPLKVGTEGPHATADIIARHPFTALPGMIENGISGVTSGVGALADAVTFADPGTHDWAYRPRTEAGKDFANLSGRASASIGGAYDKIAGEGPLAATLKERVPQAAAAAGTVAGLRIGVPAAASTVRGAGNVVRSMTRPVPMTAEQVVARQALNSPQSMGAAAAAPRLQTVSPELRQAIVTTAQKNGGAINPEVMARHVDADTLPVKIRLSEGQATADVGLLSHEQNMRGKIPSFAKRFDEQNKALAENVQAIRDEVGPDVFSSNHVEHGDTLISAYKSKEAAANTQIDAAYNQLRTSANGEFPVSAPGILQAASRELHKKLLFDHAPAAVMKTLSRLAESDNMTFENFESMRTNLARVMRSSTDGNEVAAAGVIRQAMEDLPLQPRAAALKPLADKARALAKAQFDAVDADPAYAAALNGKVPPDHFVSQFVIRGTRDDLAKMRDTIGDDPTAAQTMGVAALDHLREQARLNPNYEGNFASATFNKALVRLSPNLRSLLSQQAIEQLEQLGRVANYTTFQPRGSFVNNSNTFTAAAAEGAKGAVEGAVNYAAQGIPVGTWARKGLEGAKARRQASQAMASGAGMGRLSEAQMRQQALAQSVEKRGNP